MMIRAARFHVFDFAGTQIKFHVLKNFLFFNMLSHKKIRKTDFIILLFSFFFFLSLFFYILYILFYLFLFLLLVYINSTICYQLKNSFKINRLEYDPQKQIRNTLGLSCHRPAPRGQVAYYATNLSIINKQVAYFTTNLSI